MHLGFFLFLFRRLIFRSDLSEFGIPVFGTVIVSGFGILCVLSGYAVRICIFRRIRLTLLIFFVEAVIFFLIYVIASVFVICHMFFSFAMFLDYVFILTVICYANMNFS